LDPSLHGGHQAAIAAWGSDERLNKRHSF
jgi:hypothetical protein